MATVKRPGVPPGNGAAPRYAGTETPSELGRRLSTATDELNQKLANVEKRLAGLNLGVSARVSITDEDEGRDLRYSALAFMKRGPNWGLYLVQGREDYPDAREEETAIVSASKKHRVRAAGVINDLMEALITAAREQLQMVERANQSLDEALKGPLHDVAAADDPLADPADQQFDDIPF